MKDKAPRSGEETASTILPTNTLDQLLRMASDLDAAVRREAEHERTLVGAGEFVEASDVLVDSFNNVLERAKAHFPERFILNIPAAHRQLEAGSLLALASQLLSGLQALVRFSENDGKLFQDFLEGAMELRRKDSVAYQEIVQGHAEAWKKLAER